MRKIYLLLALLPVFSYSAITVTLSNSWSGRHYGWASDFNPGVHCRAYCTYGKYAFEYPEATFFSDIDCPWPNETPIRIVASGTASCGDVSGSNSATCEDSWSCGTYPVGLGHNSNIYNCDFNASGTCSFTLPVDCDSLDADNEFCRPPPPDSCNADQIAQNDSAYFTGNAGRYTQWTLGAGEKAVIPVSQTDGHRPSVSNPYDFYNLAVSLDENGNFLADGWVADATHAIWVDPENLDCEGDEEGYFVFNLPPFPVNCAFPPCVLPPSGYIEFGEFPEGGGPRPPPDRIDTIPAGTEPPPPPDTDPPPPPPPPQSSPILRDILDAIKGLPKKIFDPILDWLKPEPPPLGDIPEPEIFPPDTNDFDRLRIDTIPPDSLKDLDTNLFDSLKFLFDTTQFSLEKLDSLLPEKKSDTAFAEEVKEKVKNVVEGVMDKVGDALSPVVGLLGGSGGGEACACFDFSLGGNLPTGGSFFAEASVPLIQNICNSLGIIRTIILLIVFVGEIGMILHFLRS